MAKPLNSSNAKWVVRSSVLLSMLTLAQVVSGENLTDPTRPPASLRSGVEGGHQTVSSGPVLQSVLISSGRKVAIIGGQTVNLGEKFGDARVTKITESEVTLTGSNGVQTLKLFPGLEKSVASIRKHPEAKNRPQ